MFYPFDLTQIKGLLNLDFLKVNDIIEMILIIILTYYIIKNAKNTRIWIIIKGVFCLILLYMFASIFSLYIVKYVFESLIGALLIIVAIVFQTELRRVLESLGKKSFSIKKIFKKTQNQKEELRYSDKTIKEIVESFRVMSAAKTGALILIERDTPLSEYEQSGIPIHSDITSQLIINIFEKNTPLHDGAMIIKNNKISSATCYLPLTESKTIDKNLGTRHRAGIGASEETDALILIVSEETGKISIVEHGIIKHNISLDKLSKILQNNQLTGKEIKKDKSLKSFKLKILSIIIGSVLWSLLTIVINPTITVDIKDIPVTIQNDKILIESGNTYNIINGQTVTISVTGKKSDVSTLKASDFEATADFNYISISNAISINVKSLSNKSVVIDTHNALMKIKQDVAVTVDCPVTIIKEGKEKDGYLTYGLTSSLDTIKVTGPKTLVQTIDTAKATVNVSNLDSNTTESVELIIYDKNGNKIDTTSCTLSSNIVSVNCKVGKTKEIPVKLELINDVDNCIIEMIQKKLSFDTIQISGSTEMLNTLDELNIKLNLSDFESNSNKITSILNLQNYINEGISIIEDNQELEIELEFIKMKTQKIKIKKSDIDIKGGTAKIKKDIEVVVQYNPAVIDKITVDLLKPYIDISNLSSGTHTLNLQFNKNENITIKEVPEITIEIK